MCVGSVYYALMEESLFPGILNEVSRLGLCCVCYFSSEVCFLRSGTVFRATGSGVLGFKTGVWDVLGLSDSG